MSDKIEQIYQSFAKAMEEHNQASEALDNAISQLRAAKRQLQAVFEEYSELMGEYNPDMGGFGQGEPVLGLLGRFTGGRDLGSIFDIGDLF